jgi:hypothetical protein
MKLVHMLFAFAACAPLAACESPASGVDEHDLAVAARQLESIAGEARWLAQEVQAGHVSSGMAWVHQQALAQDAAKIERDLAKPVPDALRDTHARLLALGTQLESQVSRIAPNAGDRGELEALQREFAAAAQAAHPVGAKG